MIYQVKVNMFLQNEGIARGLYNHCLEVFPQASIINPDTPNSEPSKLELIENHHDEDPHKPCLLLAATIRLP